jgi:hypothetical protein
MLALSLILASLLEIVLGQATDDCDRCDSAEDDGEFAFNLFSDVAPYVLTGLLTVGAYIPYLHDFFGRSISEIFPCEDRWVETTVYEKMLRLVSVVSTRALY